MHYIFIFEAFEKDEYAIAVNKKQTKAEMAIAVLKCKCYSLNFLVSF